MDAALLNSSKEGPFEELLKELMEFLATEFDVNFRYCVWLDAEESREGCSSS